MFFILSSFRGQTFVIISVFKLVLRRRPQNRAMRVKSVGSGNKSGRKKMLCRKQLVRWMSAISSGVNDLNLLDGSSIVLSYPYLDGR